MHMYGHVVIVLTNLVVKPTGSYYSQESNDWQSTKYYQEWLTLTVTD